jgi:hypothetical protein
MVKIALDRHLLQYEFDLLALHFIITDDYCVVL